ncbi:unnamed protein product, partial [Rotaria sordida]
MEHETYQFILYGIAFGVFFVEIFIVLLLPNQLLANLIEKSFAIIRPDKQQFMVNFYGIEINFLSSRRFRLSLAFQLAAVIWIISLLLFDGCIFQ